jgi:putative ABC transport system ATP-binding protein
MSLVIADQITKTYTMGELQVPAIRGVSFELQPGSFVSFVGPSGSGKTTLLNMLGCLDHPDSGRLTVLDTEVAGLSRHAAAEFRGKHLGFIFQDFNLVPVLTAYENVEYPLLMVQARPAAERRERVMRLLDAVGMAAHKDKRPNQLSGGQKQRVAVARALVTHPDLVLADEPTANLDGATAETIIELMRHMRDTLGTTFLFSTHDVHLVQHIEVVHELVDGVIHSSREAGKTHA